MSKELPIEPKAFYFEVGENTRGRFLRVSESGAGYVLGIRAAGSHPPAICQSGVDCCVVKPDASATNNPVILSCAVTSICMHACDVPQHMSSHGDSNSRFHHTGFDLGTSFPVCCIPPLAKQL